ncbi:MAG: hypothetical protein IKK34_11040 [Clostridia bacterium]|nr:hypothetical protein [Clostridia bacterium]
MKKIIAIVLSLCLLCCAAALAESTNITPDSQSTSATVTYTITAKDEYTIVIPPSITIDSDTKTGSFTVKLLAGASLVSGNEMNIKMMSTKNDFKLMDEAGNAVAYKIQARGLTWDANSDLGTTGKVLMSAYNFPTTEDKTSDPVTLTVTGGGQAGTYSDQLNFAVSISTRPGT